MTDDDEFLVEVNRLFREARRWVKRRDWRRASTLRGVRTALTLRALERSVIPNFSHRTREATGSWLVYGRDETGEIVLVAKVGATPKRTLEDLRAPVPVDVLVPSLVDVERLAALTGARDVARSPAR